MANISTSSIDAITTVNLRAYPDSSTSGIQEAIDSLPESGGMVWIPRGRYQVRRSIVLRSRVTLRGEGAATVLLRPPPAVFKLTDLCPAHRIEAALTSTAGLRLGDEICISDKTQHGWWARHMVVLSMADNRVQGSLVSGDPGRSYSPEVAAAGGNFFPMILIPKSDDAMVTDLLIDGGDTPFDPDWFPDFTCSAVHGVNAHNLRVRGVTVRRWPSDGISAQGGSAMITECLAEDCLGNGFHPGSHMVGSHWCNNIGRRNGKDGFYFCIGVCHAVVANNIFSENRGHGIGGLTDPDAYNVITGNILARNSQCGIEAYAALGNVISGNLIQDNSRHQAGRFAGIWLKEHLHNVVTGNLCQDTGASPWQVHGIELGESRGDNLIADNMASVHRVPATVRPTGNVVLVGDAPVLDGRLDHSVWQQAAELAIMHRFGDGEPAAATTRARCLCHNHFFYLGVHCPEPYMDRLQDKITQRGGPVWMENAVELFFMPDTESALCYRLSVNSLGTIMEWRYDGTKWDAWNSRAQAAAFRGQDFWSVAIAVPLESFGLDQLQPGRILRANLYRTRPTLSPTELSCWAPTMKAFHEPRSFGTLVVRTEAAISVSH